jgi:hypothetical protein
MLSAHPSRLWNRFSLWKALPHRLLPMSGAPRIPRKSIFRANRLHGPLDSPAELNGFALEGSVAQHLRAWCNYTRAIHQLHYWHTRTGVELDFVVYGESGLFAAECDSLSAPRPKQVLCLGIRPQRRRANAIDSPTHSLNDAGLRALSDPMVS